MRAVTKTKGLSTVCRSAGGAILGAQAHYGALSTIVLQHVLGSLAGTAHQLLACRTVDLTPRPVLLQMKTGDWHVPTGPPATCEPQTK